MAKTAGIDLHIRGERGTPQVLKCLGAVCDIEVDTATFWDGLAEAYAVAHWGDHQETESPHETFHLFNLSPSLMRLTVSAMNGTTPRVDQVNVAKGTVEMEIRAYTGATPLSVLTVSGYKPSGKRAFTGSTTATGPNMKINWDTHTVPNGKYEIVFRGTIRTQTDEEFTVDSAKLSIEVRN